MNAASPWELSASNNRLISSRTLSSQAGSQVKVHDGDAARSQNRGNNLACHGGHSRFTTLLKSKKDCASSIGLAQSLLLSNYFNETSNF